MTKKFLSLWLAKAKVVWGIFVVTVKHIVDVEDSAKDSEQS